MQEHLHPTAELLTHAFISSRPAQTGSGQRARSCDPTARARDSAQAPPPPRGRCHALVSFMKQLKSLRESLGQRVTQRSSRGHPEVMQRSPRGHPEVTFFCSGSKHSPTKTQTQPLVCCLLLTVLVVPLVHHRPDVLQQCLCGLNPEPEPPQAKPGSLLVSAGLCCLRGARGVAMALAPGQKLQQVLPVSGRCPIGPVGTVSLDKRGVSW